MLSGAWLGCSGGDVDSRGAIQSGSLESGVLAMVGEEPLAASFVARVAAQHGLSKERARQVVVRDALFAQAARARFRGSGLLEVAERSAHSRALLDLFALQAKRQGPPSEAELKQLRAKRWMDLDRPVSVATVHAVVVGDPDDAKLRALAERIQRATAGAKGAKQFTARARKVDAGGLEVRVERLPFVTPDGRVVYLDPADPRRERPGEFDATFAAAANAIEKPGMQSGVVQTRFGFHVIMLLRRADQQRYSMAELASMLREDVYAERAAQRLKAIEERLRGSDRVELAPNWKELTAQASQRP